MSVAGSYECLLKTPMGDQKSVMTVTVDGDSWTGDNVGAQGTLECKDGKVDGNTLTWTMDLVVPMRLSTAIRLRDQSKPACSAIWHLAERG
jgi:hypothetical protein